MCIASMHAVHVAESGTGCATEFIRIVVVVIIIIVIIIITIIMTCFQSGD